MGDNLIIKDKYFDRELSWLRFNARVLQEASDKANSLYERIKFLGIFSNNQDEFFRVRVATLNRLIELQKKTYKTEDKDFQTTLNKVLLEVNNQQDEFNSIFQKIDKELKDHNIHIVNETELDEEQGKFVLSHFRQNVRHNLFPIMLRNFRSGASLNDASIYLGIVLERWEKPEKNTFAIIEIPTNVSDRFIVLPKQGNKQYIIFLDDVIRYCLSDIFKQLKFNSFKAYTFKFTRDAELDVDNDVSKSFLELMAESLRQRRKGSALRFVHDADMPDDLLRTVLSKLKISIKDTVVSGGRYHNFKDFMDFPKLSGPALEVKKPKPVPHKAIKPGESIIRAIRKKDIMLHYPYQSFQHIVDLLREASIDPKVRSIKMTIYRLSNPSNIINALINAARNGKQVDVFMELQARFDEEANIFWSGKLQEAGVKVMHSIPGLKVHSKLILIKRKEATGTKLYANIGTGNFHEKTGGLYCDDALLTCDPKITDEVEKVFGLFEMSFRPSRFRTLVVSPFTTRNFFLRLINHEIRNAKLGKEARVTIKLNSLSDNKLINMLYRASQAGVKINLIIRGICKLIPGVKGLSENITAISILDKYLEHSRVMIFHNDGDEKYFISSADWMVRNLDNRIEVTTPIFDKDIQKELKEMINIQLADNTKARIIDSTMSNTYVNNDKIITRTQLDIYDYLKKVHGNK